MTLNHDIKVNGVIYPVIISDSKITLQAEHQAGRVIVGYLHPQGDQDLSPAKYLIEDPDVADDGWLERVVRRHYGLPWPIVETGRLRIREFCAADAGRILPEADDSESDQIFTEAALLQAYIESQYRFFEYGIWAVERKADGVLVGKAGISDGDKGLELGYNIFAPYRNCGYATEAAAAIIGYTTSEIGGRLYARTEALNQASVRILKNLGFNLTGETCSQSGQDWYRYAGNC